MPLAKAALDQLKAGQKILVLYDEDLWHSRLLLAYVAESLWVILTPDGDMYGENLDANNNADLRDTMKWDSRHGA
eukprot:9459711-Karenia_brevis.AAC.1